VSPSISGNKTQQLFTLFEIVDLAEFLRRIPGMLTISGPIILSDESRPLAIEFGEESLVLIHPGKTVLEAADTPIGIAADHGVTGGRGLKFIFNKVGE
jgi:hypothetical protein